MSNCREMGSDYAFGTTARGEGAHGAHREPVVALRENGTTSSRHSEVIRGISPDPSADLGVTVMRHTAAPVERACLTPA
jgi:hypothetical protein